MNRPRPPHVLLALVTLACSASPGTAQTWRRGPTAPAGLSPRFGHALAYDGARRAVVLFGGEIAAGSFVNDTWEYDGAAWTRGPSAPPALTARAHHAMAYDGGRRRTVLFGGFNGPSLNDTWEYDGTAWTAGPAAPAGLVRRSVHAMAHDGARAVTVLFGGFIAGGTALRDTWEYDGAAWVAGGAAPVALAARGLHAMAYDDGRDVVVLFGGSGATGDLNDTWEYDGAWTASPPAPPGLLPRSLPALAFATDLGRSVLFGGATTTASQNDTWEHDGATWTAGPSAPAGLTPRFGPAMAADGSRDRVVLFGGYDTAYRNDTWEYGRDLDFVAGAGHGAPNPNRVAAFRPDGTTTSVDFLAYGAGAWGANAARGEITGAGTLDEILTAPGPGASLGPQVRGFLRDGTPMGKINFYAYGTLKFGANVSPRGVDADGFDEILTGAGPGDVFGPHVRGFNYDGLALTAIAKLSYFAYGTLKFGVEIEGGDLDRDAIHEVLTAPGPGIIFGPQVRGWNFDGIALASIGKVNFNAFQVPQYGGVVAGGDVDHDGFGEIGAAPGPGPTLPARYLGFDYDGTAVSALPGFDVTPASTSYGGRLAFGDMTSDGGADLVTGAGPDPAADTTVRVYDYEAGALAPAPVAFVAFPGLAFGVGPGSADLGH